MAKATQRYDNESISSLKGADRVRKRPGVIFGSDGLEGCQHAFFEILSNSIDEAREGHGDVIHITRFLDHSIQIEDFGRGMPLDYNEKEQRYNWELIYCALCRRQIQQQQRRKLRVFSWSQWSGCLRHPVFFGIL